MNKEVFLFMPHVFTKSHVCFLNENYPGRFDSIILRSNCNSFPEIEGAVEVKCRSKIMYFKSVIDILKKYDVVYLVPSFFSADLKLFIWLFYRSLIKKIVWVEWGYDLYLSKGSSIIEHLKYLCKRIAQLTFERSIPYFVAIHPIDITEYHKRIGGNAKILYAPYRFSTTQDPFLLNYQNEPVFEKLKQGKPLVIQINNCIENNLNHLEILRRLRKFANENIRIVLPMAYGDFSYMPIVEAYANKYFPGKVVCWKDYVSYEEYCKRLSEVDIFMIGVNRQRALGNIHCFMYMQKKIFFPSDSVLYNYYRENGVKVYSLDDLSNMEFYDLCYDDDLSSERQYVLSLNSENPVLQWEHIYNYINQRINK